MEASDTTVGVPAKIRVGYLLQYESEALPLKITCCFYVTKTVSHGKSKIDERQIVFFVPFSLKMSVSSLIPLLHAFYATNSYCLTVLQMKWRDRTHPMLHASDT
jgi:hypothetical protein